MAEDKKDKVIDKGISISAFVFFIMVVLGGIIIAPNFLRARATGSMPQCLANCKHIGTALKMYAEDNNGEYPMNLSQITPDYIKTIPTCSLIHTENYSETYTISPDKKECFFYCKGIHGSNSKGDRLFIYSSRGGESSLYKENIHLMEALTLRNYKRVKKIMEENPRLSRAELIRCKVPLDYVIEDNSEEMIDFMLGKGADINISLRFVSDREMGEFLLSRGARVDYVDDSYTSPLFYAVYRNDKDMVDFLIEKGANVDLECHGSTALMYVVGEGDTEMAETLLKAGANPDYRNIRGEKVLDRVKKNKDEMLALLKKYGVEK